MSDPRIVIVNENDEPIGSVPKEEAQKKGLIHRIVQVVVEDPDGRLLLQKRGTKTQVHPGGWDVSVGGHVDEGEDYLQAADREMEEEIGLVGVTLQELGTYHGKSTYEWRQLNRFYRAYQVKVPKDTKFKTDGDEVAELHWFTADEARELVSKHRNQCTAGLIEAINRFYA